MAKAVKKVPAKRVLTTEAARLVKLITQANEDYHTKGKPKLSDKQYDAMKDRLTEIAPWHPVLKQVGNAPTKRSKKVSLPFHMGSLDKIYIDKAQEIKDWLKKNSSSTYVVSDKLDGISALTGTKDDQYLYTRGNGSEGSDISHLIPYIRGVPKTTGKQAVRGEMAITKANFKKFAGDFENSRNLVAGVSNRTKEIHPASKVTDFIVHESVNPSAPLPRVAKQIERAGGKVVWHKVFRKAPTVAELAAILKERLAKSPYEIDGIVIDNLKGARTAIKGVNETAVATVSEVTWQLSRFGTLTPVVWFREPVRLAGAMVKKATGHNAKRIVDDKIGPGAMITIVRSGEVIPKLLEVVKPAKKGSLPSAGTFKWQGVDIVSTNKEDNSAIKIKQIVNFLTVLGVKSFKDRLIETLYEGGLNTVSKIVKADASRFAATGLGPTMSKKLADDLAAAIAKTTHPMLMVASNVFGKRFGKTAAKAIYSELGDKIFKLAPSTLEAKVGNIEGVGPVLAKLFAEGMPKYKAFVDRIAFTPKKVSKSGSKLKGNVYLFTGFRDAKLAAFLEHNGAEIAASLSKKVTHLIVKDKNTSNDKTAKAKQMGIAVITPDKLRVSLGQL